MRGKHVNSRNIPIGIQLVFVTTKEKQQAKKSRDQKISVADGQYF
jgi:hypothetical protein